MNKGVFACAKRPLHLVVISCNLLLKKSFTIDCNFQPVIFSQKYPVLVLNINSNLNIASNLISKQVHYSIKID